MSTEDPALRCEGVRIEYPGVVAVDAIDLTVEPGEVVALLGGSGSGKSSLLHAVAGLIAPAAGEIWLAGRHVAGVTTHVAPDKRDVGLVFQDFALWPHLNALETVAYPMRRTGRGKRDAHAAAQQLLDQLEVGHLAHRRPTELSGGQRQRVGLARALARDPRLFLFDEPTAHLDTALRAAFQHSVRERQATTGAAALYATHDPAEALALADRVALLVDGRLVQVAPPEDVYGAPVNLTAATLTGACAVVTARVGAVSENLLALDLGDGLVVVPGSGVTESSLHERQVLLRPEWLRLGGPLRGKVTARAFRGPHTDYHVRTAGGTVQLQMPGAPSCSVGDSVGWSVQRAWVLPAESGVADGSTQRRDGAGVLEPVVDDVEVQPGVVP